MGSHAARSVPERPSITSRGRAVRPAIQMGHARQECGRAGRTQLGGLVGPGRADVRESVRILHQRRVMRDEVTHQRPPPRIQPGHDLGDRRVRGPDLLECPAYGRPRSRLPVARSTDAAGFTSAALTVWDAALGQLGRARALPTTWEQRSWFRKIANVLDAEKTSRKSRASRTATRWPSSPPSGRRRQQTSRSRLRL